MRTISNLEKIKKYLNTEGTTYSMMLSGPWGSGKTYFIKNNLNDMLEKLLDKSFTMCYISLNGLTNLDDLKKMILFELLSDKKKQTKKYAALVSNIIGALSPIHYGLKAIANLTKEISNIEKSLEKVNLDNILFCFDDLERLSNKLKADEVLGFINSNLIEFANIKVLIIANEEEIKNVRNKKYINAKEKVIGRTLKHEILDMTKTLEDFSSLFNEASLLSEWLKVNDNTINLTAVIRDFKIENLRQVRNILSVFNELLIEFVSYLDELDENERNKLISIMLNNLLAVYTSVNYGDSTYLTDYSHVMDRTFKVAEQLNTMTTQDKMTKKFYETYHEKNVYFDEHIYYFDFVSNYILEVNLDLNSAKDEMNKYLDRYVRDGKSIEKAYNDIINFQYLETEDFRNVIKLFFKLLPEENTLKLSQYFNIYLTIYNISDNNILPKHWRGELIKNFKRRLKSIDSFSGESLPEISNISIDDEFKEMMELFLNAAENNKEQVINKKLEIWFSNNFSNDNDIFFEDEFKVDLFKRANSLNMIDKYLMKSNASLIMIKRALQRIYYPIDNNQEVREQKADIIEFKEKISNSSEKRNNDFIQKQNINEITNFLDEIIKKSEILMEENN